MEVGYSVSGIPKASASMFKRFNKYSTDLSFSKRLKYKKNIKYKFFWDGIFSNWYYSDFIVDGILFNCGEQYMMYHKAMTFGDTKTAQKIIETLQFYATHSTIIPQIKHISIPQIPQIANFFV